MLAIQEILAGKQVKFLETAGNGLEPVKSKENYVVESGRIEQRINTGCAWDT